MPQTVEQITQRIFDKSIPTFYDRTGNLKQLLDSLSEEYKTLYSNIDGLKEELNINTIDGTFLDDLGKLFRLSRLEGESDESYRAKIRSYWSVLTGGGTSEGIKSAIVLLVGVNEDDITITSENLIIVVQITVGDVNIVTLNNVPIIVNLAKAAGIYYDNKIKLLSKNMIFRSNLSEVNGGDTLL